MHRRLRLGALPALVALSSLLIAAPGAAVPVADQPSGSDIVTASEERFLELYEKIKDPASGYFSSHNPPIPYHSVETLIVEAPDYGHLTTSEAFSYWLLLEASYGRITGDWAGFNEAWESMETHIIPDAAHQPGASAYDPSSPATYAPELDEPSEYPSTLDFDAPVGEDPLASELSSTYGDSNMYGMHWLLDVDNRYGYGDCGDGTTSPSYINTYQRGPQESVWEPIPHPSCETFDYGGENGFVDLFTGDQSYATQWRYTNAPDADARAVQAAYWALEWATEQGNQGQISDAVTKAAKMGDYLRYSFYDKYFKQVGDCVDIYECADGTGKNSSTGLLTWYYAWGGGIGANWSWRIGSSHAAAGYQNPMAAYALSTELTPQSPSAAQDWDQSLGRQLEFFQWLQSSEGAIAGGATNSWAGRYDQPPANVADATFYGMPFDWQPVYHDPPSSQWMGFQTWSMQRVAEYYYASQDESVRPLLDKWVDWALSVTTTTADSFSIPSVLRWDGEPETWDPANPSDNPNLHVTVAESSGTDVGVASSLARTLTYYAAATGDTEAQTTAGALLDALWANSDDIGVAVTEPRADYNRFDDEVYVPPGWTGTMANGDPIESGSTFTSIRSWYTEDEAWPKVEEYLNGGAVPEFTYHRFWAQADLAVAMSEYGELFPA